jgi:hypothetical protein
VPLTQHVHDTQSLHAEAGNSMAWCGKNITVVLVRDEDGQPKLLYFGKNRHGFGQITTHESSSYWTVYKFFSSQSQHKYKIIIFFFRRSK